LLKSEILTTEIGEIQLSTDYFTRWHSSKYNNKIEIPM